MGFLSDPRGTTSLRDSSKKPVLRHIPVFAASLFASCGDQPAAENETTAPIAAEADFHFAPCRASARLSGSIEAGSFALGSDDLECESMRRPDKQGVRLRFSGGVGPAALSIIIAIPGLMEGETGKELATNLTVTVEGSGRFFSTAEKESCWTDIASQQLIADARYTVAGEVYCISPLGAVNGDGSVTVTELFFEGTVDWAAT